MHQARIHCGAPVCLDAAGMSSVCHSLVRSIPCQSCHSPESFRPAQSHPSRVEFLLSALALQIRKCRWSCKASLRRQPSLNQPINPVPAARVCAFPSLPACHSTSNGDGEGDRCRKSMSAMTQRRVVAGWHPAACTRDQGPLTGLCPMSTSVTKEKCGDTRRGNAHQLHFLDAESEAPAEIPCLRRPKQVHFCTGMSANLV